MHYISVQWQYRDHLGGQLTMFNPPWTKLALFSRTMVVIITVIKIMVVIIIVIKIMMMMMKNFQFSTLISVSHFSSGFLRMHANISLCFECLTFYSKQRTTCSLSHSTGFVVVVVAFLCCCFCCCWGGTTAPQVLCHIPQDVKNWESDVMGIKNWVSKGCISVRTFYNVETIQWEYNTTRRSRRQKASIQAPTRGLQSTVELRNSMECTGATMKQPAIETFSALWRPTRYLFLLPYPILCLWVSSNPINHHHPPTLTHAPFWQILKKLKPAVCLFEWVQEIAPPTQTNQPPPPPTHAFHTPISFLLPWLDFHGIHSHQHNNGVSIHIRSTRIFIITSLWFQRDQ